MRCSQAASKPKAKTGHRRFASLTLMILLAGCAGGSAVTRYALPPAAQASASPDGAPIVAVAEVQMPAYARDRPIATQGVGSVVHLDPENRWAGYPSELVTTALIQALRREGVNAWPISGLASSEADRRLMVVFDTYLRSRRGGALLTGTIAVIDAQKKLSSERFSIEVATEGSSYDAYVQAVAKGIGRLATSMNNTLKNPLADSGS